jgi:hypothetical protein
MYWCPCGCCTVINLIFSLVSGSNSQVFHFVFINSMEPFQIRFCLLRNCQVGHFQSYVLLCVFRQTTGLLLFLVYFVINFLFVIHLILRSYLMSHVRYFPTSNSTCAPVYIWRVSCYKLHRPTAGHNSEIVHINKNSLLQAQPVWQILH